MCVIVPVWSRPEALTLAPQIEPPDARDADVTGTLETFFQTRKSCVSSQSLPIPLTIFLSDCLQFFRAASSSSAVSSSSTALSPLARRSRLRRRAYKRALPLLRELHAGPSVTLAVFNTGAIAQHAVLLQDGRRARVRPPRTGQRVRSATRARLVRVFEQAFPLRPEESGDVVCKIRSRAAPCALLALIALIARALGSSYRTDLATPELLTVGLYALPNLSLMLEQVSLLRRLSNTSRRTSWTRIHAGRPEHRP
jgi:hypothetical protein